MAFEFEIGIYNYAQISDHFSEFDITTLFKLYDIGIELEPSSNIWHLE